MQTEVIQENVMYQIRKQYLHSISGCSSGRDSYLLPLLRMSSYKSDCCFLRKGIIF